ncbi:MAG: hypothetical protein J7L66_05215 [Anaerolineaceae bacterium]|nr:hypothetical protein [Anaerolineaceae bacterium]
MLKYTKFIAVTIVLIGCIYIPKANAATINAISCSQPHVQDAINSASDGDTVTLPVGSAIWTNPVTIPSTKGLTIQGAGPTQTIITDNVPSAWAMACFWINTGPGKSTRISGIKFTGGSGTYGHIVFYGGNTGNRVNDCTFEFGTDGGRGVYWLNDSWGVVDHCTFTAGASGTSQGVSVRGRGATSWENDLSLGTANAVYVEDCTFNYSSPQDGTLDCYNGGRYVFRYNTVNGSTVGHHGCDSGSLRSTLSFEVYENTFDNENAAIFTVMNFRGGTGVVYNNVVTGNYNNFAYVRNYRSCSSYPTWGICDGNNAYDGNEEGKEGYPCLDQIGRAPDANNDGDQDLEPSYEWNNTYLGGDGDFVPNGCSRMTTLHIIENRDFYNDTQRANYTAYTYPHPLVSNLGSYETHQPQPPSGLKIVQ